MTMHDTRVEPHDRRYDVEFPSPDPWDPTIDLGRFERLTEEERRRIIIRVLCGLVAMEEATEPTPPEPAVIPASNRIARHVSERRRRARRSAPTPGPSARLPLLGLETAAHKQRLAAMDWSTALLPPIGPERPF